MHTLYATVIVELAGIQMTVFVAYGKLATILQVTCSMSSICSIFENAMGMAVITKFGVNC